MVPFPELPAGNDEDIDGLETTLEIESDPQTLADEIRKAKEQDACLIIIRGKMQGIRFFLTRDEMIIGRDPAAEISLADEGISRRHAKVTRRGGTVLLTDLGSANGTFVNGVRITSVPLSNGEPRT